MVFMKSSVREEGTGRILGSKYDGCVTGKGWPPLKTTPMNAFRPEMKRGELK
jgi:hypothetical protein